MSHLRCGKTGAVLLHGTGCVRCDCGGAIDPEQDHRVAAFRYSQTDPWTLDDLEAFSARQTKASEALLREAARMRQRQHDEAILRSIYGDARVTDPPWHFNCRSTAGSHWRDTATRAPVEIITDPADTRGMNARRVGP